MPRLKKAPGSPTVAVLCLARRAAIAMALGGAFLLAAPQPVAARTRGIASPGGCDGCHGDSGEKAEVLMTASPTTFGPGDAVTMTVTVRSPGARVGGLYLPPPAGTLRALAGEGLVENLGLVHERPKQAESGTITFRFAWQVPATPGVGTFEIGALAGNGDNASSGDAPGFKVFEWVFGCEGRQVFWDGDGDGFGIPDETRLICANTAPPAGYAERAGDCFDFDQSIHPDAKEICNLKDDDCDGAVDQDAPPVMSWPDEDADGYYDSTEGMPRMSCGGVPGYASVSGDCGPRDAAINPGAEEVCNLKDDDCDGRIDESVRPRCGVGACRREASSCNAADCEPGAPTAEICNYLDDDCDGEIDEETFCDPGLVCIRGACVPPSARADGGGAQNPGPDAGAADSPTSGAGSAGPGCKLAGKAAPGAAGEISLLLGLAAVWATRPRRRRDRNAR